MPYYIGIDSGGTKTDAVLCDERGHVLARTLTQAGNPVDIGVQQFSAVMDKTIRALLQQGKVPVDRITAAFAGISGASMAGVHQECQILLHRLLPATRFVDSQSDIENLLTGGLLRGDGCAVISGTGCSCFTRRGGGFDFGRDAICAALYELDGRGPHTLLSRLLPSELGGELPEVLPEIYRWGKTRIAGLGRLVFDAAAEGDAVAHAIVQRNMAHLAWSVNTAGSDFEGPFETIVAGSILTRSDLALKALREHLRVDTTLRRLPFDPVFGAVLGAMVAAGIPDASLKELTFSR